MPFNALSPLHSKPRLDGLRNSPFKELPVELVFSTVELLPLPAAVSFTLTCRSFSLSLGTRYLSQIRYTELHLILREMSRQTPCNELWHIRCKKLWQILDKERGRLEFVELLQRDLPHKILCLDCSLLHSGDKSWHRSQESRSKRSRCYTLDIGTVNYYLYNGFSTPAFRKSMKLYRQGLD
jgi:hypothetical protein